MSKFHKTDEEIQDELAIIEEAKLNPNKFGEIYNRYFTEIYVFVLKRVENQDITEDITSQVFVKALQNLYKYKFKGVPFSAFLYRIASNEVNLFYRKQKHQRTVTLEDAGIYRFAEEIEEENMFSNPTEMVVKCIQTLTQIELELIEMRFFEKMSFKEIAYIKGFTESNTKVKVFRIIKKLRKVGMGLVNNG